jgi:uncharacterized protein (TIGR01777 family)
MIIAITGANGFIGTELAVFFRAKGDEVLSIPRINAGMPAVEIAGLIKGVDIIINLAGAPIIGRWTQKYKKILFDSRIITTRKLVEAIGFVDRKPQLLISASAVGIYASDGEHTESNFRKADDYLGQICSDWEQEAKKAVPFTRVAIVRFGIVLGKDGGALKRLIPLFKLGLGGKIASGRQAFPWIHINDVIQAVQFIIENQKLSGEFNLTSPNFIDNSTFTKVLAKVLGKPAFFSVPSFTLKIIYGEGAIAVTAGQHAPPKHLIDEGYHFSFPDLKEALEDIISK